MAPVDRPDAVDVRRGEPVEPLVPVGPVDVVSGVPDEDTLNEIEARAAAATEGPWTYDGTADEDDAEYGHVVRGGGVPWSTQEHMIAWCGESANRKAPEDAVFIAAARSDVPLLVEAVRVLKGENEAQEARTRQWMRSWESSQAQRCDAATGPWFIQHGGSGYPQLTGYADGHVALDPADVARAYQERYGESMPDVRSELRGKPLHDGLLADNERWGYGQIERVVYRHSFTDHDCQTIDCKAMFLWNSAEMTALLADAWQRGYAELAAVITRVRELHKQCECDGCNGACQQCDSLSWPCPTLALLPVPDSEEETDHG